VSMWAIDIEYASEQGGISKYIPNLSFDEMRTLFNKAGEYGKDYFIICVLEIFPPYKNDRTKTETINKTQMIQNMLLREKARKEYAEQENYEAQVING